MGVLPLKRIGVTGAALALLLSALAAGIDACGGSLKASTPDDSGAGSGPDYGGSSSGLDLGAASSGPGTGADVAIGRYCGPVFQNPKTSVSGRVYDPAGINPLYNVAVYITPSIVGPITRGARCGPCSSFYTTRTQASAVTDANGYFHMVGEQMFSGTLTPPVPVGDGQQLVIQVGKWRKVYTINVKACQDNPQPDHTLRLPKNSTEGSLPDIAISTGADDSLECLLRRIGMDDSEYVAGAGTTNGGHVHIFSSTNGDAGAGAAIEGGSPEPSVALWDKLSDMQRYDLVLLSCEGAETAHLGASGQQVLWDYTSNGGRVFASHFHYAWFTPTSAVPSGGPFTTMYSPPLATWTTGAQLDNSPIAGKIVQTLAGAPIPDGVALATWLGDAGALQNGELPIDRASCNAQVTPSDAGSPPLITADQGSRFPGCAQYFSFAMPPAPATACGRVVYSGLHASSLPNGSAEAGADYAGAAPGVVPAGCSSRPLTPQEKALEYMIFDLASCTSDGLTPM